MAHRVAPEAEAELDNIWYYVATESGSTGVADRLIDSITERFYLLASHPHTAYAAAYLDLAKRLSLPLATRDDDLRRAAIDEGIRIL
jgi:plasmid stabilization system protein ParE